MEENPSEYERTQKGFRSECPNRIGTADGTLPVSGKEDTDWVLCCESR